MINYADYDKTHLERKSAILRICSDSLDDIPNCSAETVRLAENCIRHIHRDQPANQAMCYLLLPKLVKSQLQSEQFSLPFIQDLVVHGTESEFRKIRLATLEMIISLASNNFEFAQYAIGVFYDMFNDESELIRMKAVSFAIELNEKERNEISNDHFSRIQLILGDQSTEIRKLAYKLVKLLKFADSNKLIAAIRILSLNAERWSSDLESVYESLSCLPARNAGHIENAVRSLLNLNPPFIPPPLVVHDVSGKKF